MSRNINDIFVKFDTNTKHFDVGAREGGKFSIIGRVADSRNVGYNIVEIVVRWVGQDNMFINSVTKQHLSHTWKQIADKAYRTPGVWV